MGTIGSAGTVFGKVSRGILHPGSDSAAASLATAAPPGSFIEPLPPAPPSRAERPPARPKAADQTIRRHEFGPMEEPSRVPLGFFKTVIRHFVVFSEGENPKQQFLTTL